jgi:lipid II:glycine glycyltransferase (peptidoglycan interpeptide bridge formation enzyme)
VEIKLITNKDEWNGWLKNQSQCSFTQSWEWGEVLKAEGKEIERVQFVGSDKVRGAAQLVKSVAPGVEYYFCPKGPVIKDDHEEILKKLNEYGLNKELIFIRVEPENDKIIEFGNSKLPIKKTIDINPRATIILELQQSEQELLEKMHSKTRYNIRLAEKKNLKISDVKNFQAFWSLMNETGKRDDFRLHEKKHYEEIFKSEIVSQLTAEHDGKAIATVVMVGFNDTITYLFGASDYEHRNLMAPYLLQWQAIKNARQNGFHYYDLFGIAPHKKGFSGSEYEYDQKHQYAGVTRFKLGFGGAVVEKPGTYDLIVSNGKYKVYEALRRLRRLI